MSVPTVGADALSYSFKYLIDADTFSAVIFPMLVALFFTEVAFVVAAEISLPFDE